MRSEPRFCFGWELALLLSLLVPATGYSAERISDVASTKHNFSSLSANSVQAVPGENGTNEVCVFCHTPHAATLAEFPVALWNRALPSDQVNYAPYSSTSLDYQQLYYENGGSNFSGDHQPSGNSKLCLSCHDGTIAVGSVTNRPGSGGLDPDGNLDNPLSIIGTVAAGDGPFSNGEINPAEGTMTPAYRNDGTDPNLKGEVRSVKSAAFNQNIAGSGFSPRIGTDLTNDHPISFTFDSALAVRDGELFDPDITTHIVTGWASKNQLPLQTINGNSTMQCTTCHDPHVKGAGYVTWNIKFLRLNRFQNPETIDTSLGCEADGSTEVDACQAKYDEPLSYNPDNVGPTDGVFDATKDLTCLGCHKKEGYAESVHVDPYAADEIYTNWAADQREFPRGVRVWQASCMNCHDNHTTQGSRRLLREGTCDNWAPETTTDWEAAFGTEYQTAYGCSDDNALTKNGGKPAIEETCFQCHSNPDRTSILLRKPPLIETVCSDPNDADTCKDVASYGDTVPDIESEFLDGIRMPITSYDQRVADTTEIHSIGTARWGVVSGTWGTDFKPGSDLLESPEKQGLYNLDNRHVECSDCHNPHRVMRNALFSGEGDESRTHKHAASEPHNNLASGALRGTWGIEPVYTGTSWYSVVDPDDSWIRSGTSGPGYVVNSDGSSVPYDVDGDTYNYPTYDDTELAAARIQTFVTREYQVCLRCHSNFAYNDNGGYQGADGASITGRPHLENQRGGTKKSPRPQNSPPADASEIEGSNGLTQYTNQLTEFNVRATDDLTGDDQGEKGRGSMAEPLLTNHRSWHPVIFPTGRDWGERGMSRNTGDRTRYRNSFLDPFASGLGEQTMYCSDCHGSSYGDAICTNFGREREERRRRCREWSTGPGRGVWGPHGSKHEFLLRGEWSLKTGNTDTYERDRDGSTTGSGTHLCFNCHNSATYMAAGGDKDGDDDGDRGTGFTDGDDNLHVWHASKFALGNWRCTMCHIAIPHGWKNKNFIADNQDNPSNSDQEGLGPEAGGINQNAGSSTFKGTERTYYNPPYYLHSLRLEWEIVRSRRWGKEPCGGEDGMEDVCGYD